ncbi:MAG: BrnT family toxin [Pseudomonadota bacterium]|nr:BrnT family toxin [Pseudomonadota bacterium]
MMHAVSLRSGKSRGELEEARRSLADADGVLNDLSAVTIEDPDAQGERRYVAIGSGSIGELLVA